MRRARLPWTGELLVSLPFVGRTFLSSAYCLSFVPSPFNGVCRTRGSIYTRTPITVLRPTVLYYLRIVPRTRVVVRSK